MTKGEGCCFTCTIIIFGVALLGAVIANIVFSILGLVDTSHKELQEQCPGTNLWVYLLVILILNYANHTQNITQMTENNPNLCTLICGLMIQIGFIAWGSYELWGVDCVDQIKSNLIYTMVFINVFVSYVVTGGGVLVSLFILCSGFSKN
jgi:hypothetical protein